MGHPSLTSKLLATLTARMKTTQRTFNSISAISLLLVILLGGLFLIDAVRQDDEALAEQLQVLGYCPPGQTLNVLSDLDDDEGDETRTDVCTPLDGLSGDLVPSADNLYTLGTSTFRWKSLELGPGTIFIEDVGTGIQAGISVEDGVLLIDGAETLRLGNVQLTTTGIRSLLGSQDITIGKSGDTGYLAVPRGIKFADGSTLTSANGLSAAGVRGATGAAGNTGPTGTPGATGAQGPAGATGTAGATGAQGPAGATGARGPTGPIGPAGSQGAVGPAGTQGPAGAQGPAGPAGGIIVGAPCSYQDGESTVTGTLGWKVEGPRAVLECVSDN